MCYLIKQFDFKKCFIKLSNKKVNYKSCPMSFLKFVIKTKKLVGQE